AVTWESPCWHATTDLLRPSSNGFTVEMSLSKYVHFGYSDYYLFSSTYGWQTHTFLLPGTHSFHWVWSANATDDNKEWVNREGTRAPVDALLAPGGRLPNP